jgi:hypothetical protein
VLLPVCPCLDNRETFEATINSHLVGGATPRHSSEQLLKCWLRQQAQRTTKSAAGSAATNHLPRSNLSPAVPACLRWGCGAVLAAACLLASAVSELLCVRLQAAQGTALRKAERWATSRCSQVSSRIPHGHGVNQRAGGTPVPPPPRQRQLTVTEICATTSPSMQALCRCRHPRQS